MSFTSPISLDPNYFLVENEEAPIMDGDIVCRSITTAANVLSSGCRQASHAQFYKSGLIVDTKAWMKHCSVYDVIERCQEEGPYPLFVYRQKTGLNAPALKRKLNKFHSTPLPLP